jgi:PAS domain-containing protein
MRVPAPTPRTDLAKRRESEFYGLLDQLPAAAYTCDADGLITYFNERAAELWGREPKLNDPLDRF